MKKIFAFFLFALLMHPQQASADTSTEMLRVLCMPEEYLARFYIDVESYHNLSVLKSERAQRLERLKEYGLIHPKTEFSYECNLPGAVYTIFGGQPLHREKGMCGGDPRITLSLKDGERTLLDAVYFTPSCFGEKTGSRAYISKINIEEAGGPMVTFILSDSHKNHEIILKYGDKINLPLPVTQKYIDCLVRENVFDSKSRQPALTTCNEQTQTNVSIKP